MNIKKLFLLIIFSCTQIILHLHTAADKPIVVFAQGPFSLHESRVKFTITPESVQVLYTATEEILSLPPTAKVFTVGRLTPGGDFIITTDPNAPTPIETTRIEICPEGVRVDSWDYDGGVTNKTIKWCGCTTIGYRLRTHNRFGILDPETSKCTTCKEKEELEAIDRLIEQQNKDMETWLLR